MDILRAAARNASLVAVKLPNGVSCSYGKLLQSSELIRADLQKILPPVRGNADGPRIGIFAEPGLQYVAATWASWLSGGIAVPLAVSHPEHELDYIIRDAGISAVLTSPCGHDRLKDVTQAAGATLHVLEHSLFQETGPAVTNSHNSTIDSVNSGGRVSSSSDSIDAGSGALIVYTSGTTGRPKGALHTHRSLSAQMRCLTEAWQWSPGDVMVHALPLHHVHGVINGLYCAHYVGATVHLLPKFSPAAMWKELQSGDISVLMAVPTMYNYLLSYYESQMPQQQKAAAAAGAARLRLAVCGSAAAPVALLQRWQALSGQLLLERYGMTETGMILSNPYRGERRAGFVGVPLPGVEVKVVQQGPDNDSSSDNGSSSRPTTVDAAQGAVGELAVRGPMLFREYWGRPEATAASFDEQGYFLTGDTVSLEGNPPYYRILGRSSVDIIKSGGYKLSALDIEGALLHHSAVAEAAVVGVPDEMLGQVVTAIIYPKSAAPAPANGDMPVEISSNHTAQDSEDRLIQELQEHCRGELAAYAVPRHWRVLNQPLPRNAMGKVNKKQLLQTFFPEELAAAARSS